MSCFVMNPEPLAALANAVETRLNCDYNYWGFDAPASLYDAMADCKTSCTYFAEDIYRRLYAVNVRSYNGRYSSHEEPADEEAPTIDGSKYIVHHPPEYREHGFAVRPWHFQLAKLLDCWLYQTAEDATYKDPLRLAMAEFRDNLYSFIVLNSPEYTAGRWGELPSSAASVIPPVIRRYDIAIVEYLKRTVHVEAASWEEAKSKVEQAWNNGEHVLTADDFAGVSFNAVSVEGGRS